MNSLKDSSDSSSSDSEEDWDEFVEFVPKDYLSLSMDEWYDILTSYDDNVISRKDLMEMRKGMMEYIRKNSDRHDSDD